jgi:hypothetical protein
LRSVGVVLELVLLVSIAFGFASKANAEPPLINVTVSPSAVTPHDPIYIEANVTSTIEIRNVTIFHRFGPPKLTLHSKSDYTSDLMLPTFKLAGSARYSYMLKNQSADTDLYFFVEATNTNGDSSSWPGNLPEAERPRVVPIRNPAESYLYTLVITIDRLDLGLKVQRVNITVDAGPFIPNFPQDYWIQTTVFSGDYYAFYLPLMEGSLRFDYYGKASGWVTLTNGQLESAPFDNYTMAIKIDLRYSIMNLTSSVKSVPIYFGSMELWNSWNVSPSTFEWGQNRTSIIVRATIARSGVTGFSLTYPPLVLLFTGFGMLGVVPLVATYQRDKRFEVYLNAIILGASAELSQTLFLPGAILFQNFFTLFFAFLLVFSFVMMTITVLSAGGVFRSLKERLPEKIRNASIPVEGCGNLVMSAIIGYEIRDLSIPSLAKILLVLLNCCGVIMLGVIYCAKGRLQQTNTEGSAMQESIGRLTATDKESYSRVGSEAKVAKATQRRVADKSDRHSTKAKRKNTRS